MNIKTITFLAAFIGLFSSSANADGPLDPTFYQGYGVYEFAYSSTGDSVVAAVTQDPAGHLLTAGANNQDPSHFYGYRMVLTRQLAAPNVFEGDFDSRFGTKGFASNPFGSNYSFAVAVTIDHHGRLIVAGETTEAEAIASNRQPNDSCATPPMYFFAARFVNDDSANAGELDTSFGTDGVARTTINGCFDSYASGMTIDNDDNIVVVGSTADGTKTPDGYPIHQIALVRWHADGTIDTTFGTNGNGVVMTAYIGEVSIDGVGIASDSSNRLLVAGRGLTPRGTTAVVYRYLSDGSFDTTFGVDGVAAVSTGPQGTVRCIAVDSANRPVIAGQITQLSSEGWTSEYAFVSRFTSDGKADQTFGTNGTTRPDVNMAGFIGLALDRYGRALAAGSQYGERGLQSAALVHFNLDGSINSAAGDGGIFSTLLEAAENSYVNSVLIDDMGRPVVSATTEDPLGSVSALIRYDEIHADGFD